MVKIRFSSPVLAAALFAVTGVLFQNCSPGFNVADQTKALSSEGLPIGTGQQSEQQPIVLSQDATISTQRFACPEPQYRNFQCIDKILRTSESREYAVRFRWNRVGLEALSSGTVIWVLGGDGRRQWRVIEPNTIPTQDYFDTSLKIRSVEIEFLDDPKVSTGGAGYWVHGGGYYSAASAYLEAVKYVAANLKVGTFMNHVGGSNGTMVAAYALSHFNVGSLVDRFVLHAGPFLPNLGDACNPTHFASFNKSPQMFTQIKNLLGTWSFLDPNRDVCGGGNEIAYRNSVLNGALSVYPRNGIHVVMGAREATEGFGDWILLSNLQWHSQVQAADKTRAVYADLGHAMHWDSVRTYAALRKPSSMGFPPSLTFSTTENGPAVSQISVDSRVYGRIQGIDASSAMGCMQLEAEFSKCDDPNNWTAFPNGDWVYMNGVWRYSFIPSQVGIRAGSVYKGFNVNTRTGQRTPTVTIRIAP